MPYQLQKLSASNGSPALPAGADFQRRIDHLNAIDAPRYRLLWAYYQNPMRSGGRTLASTASLDRRDDRGTARPYREAQEWGLPTRLVGDGSQVSRKEIVVENDIAWRVDTLVDYLFGKSITLNSGAPDPARREAIENLLRRIFEKAGGIGFFQQIALLGAVYGFIDVLVKLDPAPPASQARNPSTIVGTGIDIEHGDSDHSSESRNDASHPDDSGSSDEDRPNSPAAAAGESSADPLLPPAGPGNGSGEPSADDEATDNDEAPASSATAPASSGGAPAANGPNRANDAFGLDAIARRVRLEIVEPSRALPLLSPLDYRQVDCYAQVYSLPRSASQRPRLDDSVSPRDASAARAGWLQRLLPRLLASPLGASASTYSAPGQQSPDDDRVTIAEVITPAGWQRYEDGRLIAEGINALGEIPLVHIQNAVLPFRYCGTSEVETLIPLQDELNTRLSDRAHRITMQSFKMYLGKNIEGFNSLPIAPGQMWMTDNADADVVEFGGDANCPSEDRHISEVREALDKASGVTPIAAGAVEGRIGQLTSAAALRVTLQALLSKTERKRTTYGAAIERTCALALKWLHVAGIFETSEEERQVTIQWPSPLPNNDAEKLQEAQAKLRLGVPRDVVLKEIGY